MAEKVFENNIQNEDPGLGVQEDKIRELVTLTSIILTPAMVVSDGILRGNRKNTSHDIFSNSVNVA